MIEYLFSKKIDIVLSLLYNVYKRIYRCSYNDNCVHIPCFTNRGIMATSSLTQTTILRGSFKSDSGTKKEFFDNIKLQQPANGSAY
jgi:hypothetical protein